MTKYSDEFKLKVVKDYLEGSLGYQNLAKKHNISDKSIIRRWVIAFQSFGRKGIISKQKNTVYSVTFKLDILHYMKRTGDSFQDTAIKFGLNNPSIIIRWKKIYDKEGVEGLKKPKGRPPMTKKKKQKPNQKLSREKELEREIENLRLENAYLKKLNAFRENPNAFLEKHKQQWHSNSKKKDSN
ncbi:transposase [Staphylococcus sciuri]|uniref:helix-turn-helix domain-containing protein n=1 Tax=Mammaliicoccus sciuri TaxID=1296 RepID=UPI0018C9000E|nr:helix-turn-helix domain-containing protein [Mammaliicoccus sciuri]MBG9206945.1 transposase [Mammaliicoccus sciuri]